MNQYHIIGNPLRRHYVNATSQNFLYNKLKIYRLTKYTSVYPLTVSLSAFYLMKLAIPVRFVENCLDFLCRMCYLRCIHVKACSVR